MEIPRQQGFEVVSGACGGQAVKRSFEPEIGLDAIGLGSFDERVDECAGVRAGLRVGEQPGFSPQDEGLIAFLALLLPVIMRRMQTFKPHIMR